VWRWGSSLTKKKKWSGYARLTIPQTEGKCSPYLKAAPTQKALFA